jgi:hypothetical protein
VDARDRLRRYLEQRRETGERELQLDGMSVDDVLSVVSATGALKRRARPAPGAELPEPPPRAELRRSRGGTAGSALQVPFAPVPGEVDEDEAEFRRAGFVWCITLRRRSPAPSAAGGTRGGRRR